MRQFTVVLTIADEYDRYTSAELIPTIEAYVNGLNLTVVSGTVQMAEVNNVEQDEWRGEFS